MKNKEQFNSIELKLIEEFEAFGNSEVGAFYISSSTDSEAFSTKAELMEAVTATLDEWYKENYPIDLINSETLETVGDYLPLFLALPNDCTVLAVGNGAVAAPSTTTAYLHEDYHGNKLLAVYDYEVNEEAVKADLEELFPSTPPQWFVTFKFSNSDDDYIVRVEAEDRAEAIPKAVETFNKECSWHYMPWKSIDIKPMDEETAEPETAEEEPNEIQTEVGENGNVYAFKDIGFTRYEVGELEPKQLDIYNLNGDFAELIESKCREDMTPLEYELQRTLYKTMMAEKERRCK